MLRIFGISKLPSVALIVFTRYSILPSLASVKPRTHRTIHRTFVKKIVIDQWFLTHVLLYIIES
jgi:hypothetical protein